MVVKVTLLIYISLLGCPISPFTYDDKHRFARIEALKAFNEYISSSGYNTFYNSLSIVNQLLISTKTLMDLLELYLILYPFKQNLANDL